MNRSCYQFVTILSHKNVSQTTLKRALFSTAREPVHDVVVPVALLRPLAQTQPALQVEVTINQDLAVLALGQQEHCGGVGAPHHGLDLLLGPALGAIPEL